MKLRTKIVGALALLCLFSLLAIVVSLRLTLVKGLLEIEHEDHSRNVQRVLNSIKASDDLFVTKMMDWAAWDDSYEFVQKPNQEYIDSNLEWNTFDVLELNMMLYLDTQERVKFFRGRDYTNEVILKSPPQAISDFIQDRSELFNWTSLEDFRVGFIRSGDEIFHLVFRPITNSEMTKEAVGTLFYARYFREAQLKRLEEITHYHLNLRLLDEGERPDESSFHIRPISEDTVSGKAVLKDIFGVPIAELTVQAPRLIYQQGIRSLRTTLFVVALLSLALLLGVGFLINRLMVSRLLNLNSLVGRLQSKPSPEALAALKDFGKDEIGVMSHEIHDLYFQVRRLADYDDLTGVHNQRFFRSALETQVKSSHRYRWPLSLIILDVDHFKGVNDRYGHLQGDAVLKAVGATLRVHTRSTDVSARYGGEEFALMLPETDAAGAAQVAEKLRLSIEEMLIPQEAKPDDPLRITVSLGVATLAPGTDAEKLVEAADQALYRAKQGGRNRVEVSV